MNPYGNYGGPASGNNPNGQQQQQQQQQLASLSSQNYQQDSPAASHVLPPIHSQANGSGGPYSHQIYRSAAVSSAPHTPRTPHAPGTPVNGGSTANLSQIAPQNQASNQSQPVGYAPVIPSINTQPPTNFMSGASQNGGSAYPQQMPHQMGGQLYSQLPSMYQLDPSRRTTVPPSLLPPPGQTIGNTTGHIERLAPVVGSQGRRGILPSLPGRPTISGDGTAARAALNPVNKTADGKFPCSYCNKTYLHLKHLKRHLLRRE
jgi:hypothetical protein